MSKGQQSQLWYTRAVTMRRRRQRYQKRHASALHEYSGMRLHCRPRFLVGPTCSDQAMKADLCTEQTHQNGTSPSAAVHFDSYANFKMNSPTYSASERRIPAERGVLHAQILLRIAPSPRQARFAQFVSDSLAGRCTDPHAAMAAAQKAAPDAVRVLLGVLNREGANVGDAYVEHMNNLLRLCIVVLPFVEAPDNWAT